MDDEQILLGLRGREEDAFSALTGRYVRYIGAVVSKVAGGRLSKEDVEEICSDVLFRIWQKAADIELCNGSMKSYIGAASRNAALNRLRTIQKVEFEELKEDSLCAGTTEEAFFEREGLAALGELVAKMEEPDREIFVRRYFFLERVRDIARSKGLNEKSVSTRLSRMRIRLQKLMEQD